MLAKANISVYNLLLIIMLAVLTSGVSANNSDINVGVYEDVTGNLGISEVTNQTFIQHNSDSLKLGFSSSAFWAHVNIPQSMEERFLYACYTQIDKIDAFILEDGTWRRVSTGDARPFKQRDVPHPCFVFDLAHADGAEMYLRLESDTSMNIRLQLEEQQQFWQQSQINELGHGICFAFLLAMIIYNFFLFTVIQEAVYFYYVGYLTGITLFLATMSGHAAMYFWPESDVWNDYSPVVTALIACAFGLMFVRAITQIQRFKPIFAKAMLIAAILSLVLVLATFISPIPPVYLLSLMLAIALPLFAIAIIISCMNGWKPAYFMLIGLVIVIPGVIIYYLRVNGILSESWLTNNIMHFTTVVEAMLLSFALAFRIRLLNEQIEQHQRQELVTQSNLSRSLIKATDNERRIFAQELHDHFGQGLLAVKNLVKQFSPNEDQQLAVKQLNNLVADSRNMARNMHPQQIENLGFTTALKTMLDETLIPSGIKLNFSGEDISGWLPKDSEIQLYRIAQESVSNIVHHAQAQNVVVDLQLAGGGITLRIKDDGVGIDPSQQVGLGIANMQERASMMDATISIHPELPSGTETVVQVALI